MGGHSQIWGLGVSSKAWRLALPQYSPQPGPGSLATHREVEGQEKALVSTPTLHSLTCTRT